MAARPMGSATISFGLVSIPVDLFPASESSAAISFNLLHDSCHTRLKQHYVCPKDGETVERDHMVKGYEFEKGKYVVFTPEELKALEEQANQVIEIAEFVPLSKVDPLYFDRGYYLGPKKGAERAYRLLSRAMKETGRCGLARYAARGKQYLVLVRSAEDSRGGLLMQQLHYRDEIRPFAEVDLPEGDVKEGELKLAIQLTEQVATDEFHPEKYEDDVKRRVEELIHRKVEGQEISTVKPEAPKTQVIDLMEALKASLAARGVKKGAAPERRPAVRSPRAAPPAEKPRALKAVGGKRNGK